MPTSLRILYLGESIVGSTSAHRADALKRLGHTVQFAEPYKQFAGTLQSRIMGFIHHRNGFFLLQPKINQWLTQVMRDAERPDLVWIDSGELFGPSCLKTLKSFNIPVVLYNIDDPTGKRDGNKFSSLIKALPYYDLVVVVRKETEAECIALGAKRVMRVMRSYDEVWHKAFENTDQIPEQFRSEVAFMGTWMHNERRDEFLLELIAAGIPVSIWGDRWTKGAEYSKLKDHWKGGTLRGKDYVAAIQGAKICLGLLSKGNRDLHTTRSLEVPYAGGLLCAERTTEHQDMYKDGEEAVFWSDAQECIQQCRRLLLDDTLREKIRQGGMRRVMSMGVGNEVMCSNVLKTLLSPETQTHNASS